MQVVTRMPKQIQLIRLLWRFYLKNSTHIYLIFYYLLPITPLHKYDKCSSEHDLTPDPRL